MRDEEIPEFGLRHSDYNYKLLAWLNPATLSKFALTDVQIIALADRLDWDVISQRALSGTVLAACGDRINWQIFIYNGKRKRLNHLDQARDVFIVKCRKIFMDMPGEWCARYYTRMFISMFPTLVQWDWCVRNVQLGDFLLEKYWNVLNKTLVSRWQKMSNTFIYDKRHQINWAALCDTELTESFMDDMHDFIDWKTVSQTQKLSESFIAKNKAILDADRISRYQSLSGDFIIRHKGWLDMRNVSRWQKLSYHTIQEIIDYLDIDCLMNNPYCQWLIRCVPGGRYIYIIDATNATSCGHEKNVIFCKAI